ncbi:MAG: GDYXXLXY domain-containing protein [Syntrophomonadaceae bacterium]|nr:GDYXXLXY domain-containing protein [Syntrophomonadaceae bacterium]
MNKKTFYLVVSLQALFLVGMILINQSILWCGQEVILETEPIDPYSLFSGEYVSLRYKAAHIPLDKVQHPDLNDTNRAAEHYARGSRVFVQLEKQGDAWQAVKISKQRKDMGNNLYMTARVDWIRHWSEGKKTEVPHIWVHYGIESYYTPEGTARNYERMEMRGLKVKVAVDSYGRSKIIGLIPPNK